MDGLKPPFNWALSALMTKNQFIENLKSHQKQTELFAKKISITAVIVIAIFFLLLWLKPFEGIIDYRIILSICLLIVLVFFGFISSRHEKNNDKENYMHCRNCRERFDQNTLSIAVLENKCQECGAKIYDT